MLTGETQNYPPLFSPHILESRGSFKYRLARDKGPIKIIKFCGAEISICQLLTTPGLRWSTASHA